MTSTETRTTLTGSEKQVAWAEDIRAKMLPILAEVAEAFRANAATSGQSEALVAAGLAEMDARVALIGRQTKASYWIDNRHMGAAQWRTRMRDIVSCAISRAKKAEVVA